MDDKYKITVPPNAPIQIITPDDFFQLPFININLGKRGSGKSLSTSNFLKILHNMKRLDRIILVSATYENNSHYYAGLPLDVEKDIIEPEVNSAQRVVDIVEEEARLYDKYFEDLEKYKKLMKIIKEGKEDIYDIDENLFFSETLEKPTYKYMRNGVPYKPIIVAYFDDTQGTYALSPKSKVNYLAIRQRHIGNTIHKALGVSLIFSCQNYCSASQGLPKTIRGNATILCVFKNKNKRELDVIAQECAGEVDVDKFNEVFEEATKEDYGFLTIDFNKKKTHPSMFRKCFNEFIL